MAKQVYQMGSKLGDPNGCVVCHGGDPVEEKEAVKAHSTRNRDNRLRPFLIVS